MTHPRISTSLSLCSGLLLLFTTLHCGGDAVTGRDGGPEDAGSLADGPGTGTPGSEADAAASTGSRADALTANQTFHADAAHDVRAPLPNPDGPPPAVRKLDVLVVVDNSGSMTQEQASLSSTFPALIRELEGLPGGLPDLHLGVVSSDVGAGGSVIAGNPACSRPGGGDRGWLDPANKAAACGVRSGHRYLMANGASTNFAGTLANAFGCMAQLGTSGCGFEHQLQSARLALLPGFNTENAGFLRDDAHLLVIILSDEDDCSSDPDSDLYTASTDAFPGQNLNLRCALRGHVCGGTPVPNGTPFEAPLQSCAAAPGGTGKTDLIPLKQFVDFFRELKRDPRQLLVSAIIGTPPPGQAGTYRIAPTVQPGSNQPLLDLAPVCTSANGEAAPALRLQAFVDAFGARGRVESICAGDFAPALTRIGQLVRDAQM